MGQNFKNLFVRERWDEGKEEYEQIEWEEIKAGGGGREWIEKNGRAMRGACPPPASWRVSHLISHHMLQLIKNFSRYWWFHLGCPLVAPTTRRAVFEPRAYIRPFAQPCASCAHAFPLIYPQDDIRVRPWRRQLTFSPSARPFVLR